MLWSYYLKDKYMNVTNSISKATTQGWISHCISYNLLDARVRHA